MEDWGAVRDRLDRYAEALAVRASEEVAADIRAALGEIERLRKALEDERSGKAKAKRARNAEAAALRGESQ